jgi:hypothetical protein
MHVSGGHGPWAQGHPFCFLGSLGVRSVAFHSPRLFASSWASSCEKCVSITKKNGLSLFTESRIQDTVWVSQPVCGFGVPQGLSWVPFGMPWQLLCVPGRRHWALGGGLGRSCVGRGTCLDIIQGLSGVPRKWCFGMFLCCFLELLNLPPYEPDGAGLRGS